MDFHSQIFAALGFRHNMYDGAFVWPAEVPSAELLSAVESLPDNETEFITVDLTAFPVELQTYQCDRIRELRGDAYKAEADRLYMGAQADGDSLSVWTNKRDEIKARYPWPGNYRG